MNKKGQLDRPLYRFHLTGGVALSNDDKPYLFTEWLPDKSLGELGRLGQLPTASGDAHELADFRLHYEENVEKCPKKFGRAFIANKKLPK